MSSTPTLMPSMCQAQENTLICAHAKSILSHASLSENLHQDEHTGVGTGERGIGGEGVCLEDGMQDLESGTQNVTFLKLPGLGRGGGGGPACTRN